MATNEKKIDAYCAMEVLTVKSELLKLINNASSLKTYEDKDSIIGYAKKLLESIADQIANEMYFCDIQVVKTLDIDLLSQFDEIGVDVNILDEILAHLYNLAIATDNVPGLDIYETKTFHNILESKVKEFDYTKFIHTLRQAINGNEKREHAVYILKFLGDPKQIVKTPYSNEDIIVLLLCLNVVWASFSSLAKDRKFFALQNCLYNSIVLGIPTRQALEKELYITTNVLEYLLVAKDLADGIKNNKEYFFLGQNVLSKNNLNDTLEEYTSNTKIDASTYNMQKKFISGLCLKNKSSAKYTGWLEEFFDIYFKLQEGSLIEKNLGGEKDESDLYFDEMTELMRNFIHDNLWSKIVDYFKKKDSIIDFDRFLGELANNLDLDKDLAIVKLSKFSEFLHKNNLLPINKELIEFDESKGKFQWVEDVVTVIK